MIVTRYSTRKFRFSFSSLIQPLGLLVVFSVVGTLLLLAQLLIANKLATDGEKVSEIEGLTQHLEDENIYLANQVVMLGSLNQIAERARDSGLVKVSRVEVITPIPVAYAP